MVGKAIRKWMSTFMFIKNGGLSFPSLKCLVPIRRMDRLKNMKCTNSRFYQSEIAKCENMLLDNNIVIGFQKELDA